MIDATSTTLTKIPIDQFGRYRMVADMIKKSIIAKKQNEVKILDIGGYRGLIADFFAEYPSVTVTIIDMYDVDQPNYVKGDARALPFEDNSFDYVVSFEVLEHIPRDGRYKYVSEAIRVSKGLFLLSAPFAGDEDEAYDAEKAVNGLWKQIHKQDHQWLKEHIEYKTPKNSELEAICQQQRLAYRREGNNDLALWVLVQSFTFLNTTYRKKADVDSIIKFYNANAATLEKGARRYYRYVYQIGQTEKDLLAQTTIEKRGASAADKSKLETELIVRIFKQIQKDVSGIIDEKNKQIDELYTSIQEKDGRIIELQAYADQITKELDYIRSSRTWRVLRFVRHSIPHHRS